MPDQLHTQARATAVADLVTNSLDAVVDCSPDGTVLHWNDGAAALYGRPAEQMVGLDVAELVLPQSRPRLRESFRAALQGEVEGWSQALHVGSDGRPITVARSVGPVRDEAGLVVGCVLLARAVTDREDTDLRMASLLEAAPDAMVCSDQDGTIVLANSQAAQLFGYDHEELTGTSVDLLVPDDLRGRHPGHRQGYLHHPVARPMGSGMELRARRRDGSTFAAEISLAHVDDPLAPRVLVAVRDVSVQRSLESALRESETRLRQLAENIETVVMLHQSEPPQFLYISPGLEKLTGYTPEEAMADSELFKKIVHPDDRGAYIGSLQLAVEEGETAVIELRMIRKDGEIRWVRTMLRRVPDEGRGQSRLVSATDDITESVLTNQRLQEAEVAARAANVAKNHFLSRMSHELRTPLNAILGFGQLLELALADTEHAPSVRYVLSAGRHLLDLINDVLDIARIDNREMSMSREPVAADAMLDEVLHLMEPLAEQNDVHVECLPVDPELFVLADRQRLRQIMLNLVGNAIKYHRPGGHVWMEAAASEDDTCLISVRDDGPGIAPALHSRLFTPFDRLGAESTSIEGTGVGLAITRGLAELMNGAVTCVSEEGQGARFDVRLPGSVAPHGHDPLNDVGAHVQGSAVSPARTVLYVEDNTANVHVMESIIKLRPGWSLIHAALGGLGLELAVAHRPDLILLDLHLPDVSGLELLRHLASRPQTAAIPVVVLSADASDSQIRRAIDYGAKRYLTKPFELRDVVDVLDEAAAIPISPVEKSST